MFQVFLIQPRSLKSVGRPAHARSAAPGRIQSSSRASTRLSVVTIATGWARVQAEWAGSKSQSTQGNADISTHIDHGRLRVLLIPILEVPRPWCRS
ncbi:hypothetical protein BDV59DRAFT_187462 [Aspergillus ambiguus]|uniref:uncharacterized protein n=1 Tax=Aspergillus ambiguus TaxID=176160 RepID=UPI003CCE133F